uniref:PX domain-containing protein n=1 Tax=Kalanchoe fedtschenkoi TaxID=63787 RepID=A0A7N0R8E4_KALFE
MMRSSPPRHRHDGTSPLPLGMDWSPPPRKWNEKDTVWPHDPRTGWSYCVTIPSWSLLPTSRNADPVVFYRVQIGVQSPEGHTTLWGVLRRFNDFLKLYTHLKNAFPKKNLPPAPPKGLMRLKTRALLDERRLSLEEWLSKLLSDIDVSRSVPVASFLELEAAARASFQDENQHIPEVNPSGDSSNSSAELHHGSSHLVAGSSSLASDYGSDTAYETSEIGTPKVGRGSSNSEIGLEDLALDDDSTSPIEKLVKYGMSNLDEGLFMGETLLEELEGFPKYKGNERQRISSNGKNTDNGFDCRSALVREGRKDLNMKAEHSKAVGHTRKLSIESVSSDVGSIRGSDISDLGNPVFSGNGSLDLPGSSDDVNITNILNSKNSQLILPSDQRQKLNRYLISMQRRLSTARTDMEDLISRLDQEIAVKEYLTTKVKDIEGELESTRQKSKENLQQALLHERERYTQMQWDMEELKRKSLEMEIQLKSQQGEKPHAQPTRNFTAEEKDALSQELGTTKEQLKSLQKHYEELELKSKADIKVLVKEVKLLRSSQRQLKDELSQSDQEKADAQRLLQEEKLKNDNSVAARRELLDECKALQKRLQECNNYLLTEEEDQLAVSSSSLSEALDLLAASDSQIGLLIAKV